MQDSVPKAAPEPSKASSKDRHGGMSAAASAPTATTHAATAAEATATLQVRRPVYPCDLVPPICSLLVPLWQDWQVLAFGPSGQNASGASEIC